MAVVCDAGGWVGRDSRVALRLEALRLAQELCRYGLIRPVEIVAKAGALEEYLRDGAAA